MVATDPLWLPSLSYDETELRKMDAMMAMADGTAGGSRGGVRPGDTGLAVSLAGTTINVTAGVALVPRAGQGAYRVQMAATSPGTLTAANASFTRIDLVYLRVWDTAVDSSGLRKADTVYLAGTASGSPVAPTPGGTEIYTPLATITVPSTGGGGTGAATVSTAVRQVTVAPGGVLPVTSTADLAISGTYTGQTRYNTVRGSMETWTGAAWVAPGDWVTYTPTWAGTTGAPTLGNGLLKGRYSRIGRTCTVQIFLKIGSTTTQGSGSWSWTLPFNQASAVDAAEGFAGSAFAGVGAGYPALSLIQSNVGFANKMVLMLAGSPGTLVGPGAPIVWTTGSTLSATLTYETT
ncbi:hypothetical protein [Streptomyces sp. ISL-94]|uniref:hypothetical protein n=1 Tax=Streptomyces sp. ISL-94 TaxID=2819190 RepID=UPI001BE757B3|nr:hypothetical protein [Streptomyces sp. ISL-94]MBT2477654.1 hypothetical protein [Streptomyces sp. ISL-94]